MASLVARAKLLKNLRHFTTTTTRPLNSSTPSSSSSTSATAATAFSALNLAGAADTKIEPTITTTTTTTIPKSTSILDFDDLDKLFSSVSTSKLLRASANLYMASVEPIVDLGMWVMRSKLMEKQLVKDMVLGLIKRTFFEHFCAGENTVEAGNSALRLRDAGLRGMLDYALEFACDNESCDRNMEGFLTTIESTKSLPPSIVSFVVVKISAICPLRLLERVSDLLRWQHKNPSCSLPWKLNTFPIFSDSSPTYHTLTEPQPLTPEEERDLQLAHQRLLTLCQECLEANLPLLVDAEHTAVQPAIDYLTYSSAIMYNKDNNPIVYGTLQAYLKDAGDRLFLATKAAEKMGVPLGVKLVRGAYMSSERELASSLGYESPIHNTIQDTHSSFNDCASFMLERLANGSDALVLATHNVQSGKLAAAKAHDLGIGRVNQKLEFAQLYGMADSLSYGLGNAGFQVSKYMPFGPIDVVMPYLLRRAEENRGMLSSSTLDRELMRKELKRRLIAAVL
ncbi:hypothetical protein FEM48_Zijuj04G0064700 [Ziziphus jujuba var. spinosa]|uniref:Proline dehydrogenase n=1 Tax=Ziziphus jujuba var. spinosa TaxID=714518 RepID=A0A978VIB7_ZIZJJ|nr:hypothetical protein FEM48_Zijuj04G0064700 [Ziziphus jujuba var. spinosa]